MKTIKLITAIVVLAFAVVSCNNATETAADATETQKTVVDPLPSWNDGATKDAIVMFVNKVTDESSSDFVAIEDRIATFDNDGNLWAEQPLYFQLVYVLDRIKAMAADHPEWKTTQPYQVP